ncbi:MULTISPECIES: FKBP-type peptidyl-prolyl cis-trans isomerase [Ectothiorhodospira]|uniref:FKBP-type peptidyl-prolyl cis-trans isomerase n=1 Tax=Ectothiorhodospira TaxID=1051 RepID=UPI00024A8651|nr:MULTISPECIES: peptidylprolyl isomerase [Ectothiorhodospira]EHQ52862.1 peptidyl-prolyl cis-trans isomerase SlyD [Ectothiorhodospira sp. PHS-1]MCG5512240.1 peptidylprolyl isomerase [Ectothiorhodospira shaposhnikovii]
MQIGSNKVVSIAYTLTDEEGRVIDQSSEQAPFAYLHGASNIIPGLEKALEGKQAGDELEVKVAPEQAYGERDDSLVHTLNRSQFQGVDELEVGMQFHAGGDNGGMQVVTITAIDGDDVVIDANHPLAGVTLNFQVKIHEVRDATPEELDHGHAHGPGAANDH